MRRPLTAALAAVALTVGLAAPAAAHPRTGIAPPIGVDLTHTSTDNVGFVARFHEHFGTAGGILTSNDAVEDLYVVTDPRGVFTYDVATPEAPVLLGVLAINQTLADGLLGSGTPGLGVALGQEDPSTDGDIVLVDGIGADGSVGMQVIDISDPTAPTRIGNMSTTDHTWTCVTDVDSDNGCGWAYGRDGHVVDLSDPTTPEIVANWREAIGDSDYTHDFTEIRPGLVMSAGAKPKLLDTTDPTDPVLLTQIDELDHPAEVSDQVGQRTFESLGYHSVEWANDGTDPILVMGTEIAPDNGPAGQNLAGSPDCQGPDSVIETWDATAVVAALETYDGLVAETDDRATAAAAAFGAQSPKDRTTFERLDAFDAGGEGIFLDGASSSHQLYCAHWMEYSPDWDGGGRLAIGYYDRGTRFVEVDGAGQMREIGWFIGAEAYTGSAQWVDSDTIFIHDYRRGMEIVNLAPVEATGTYTADSPVSENALTIAEMAGMGIAPPAEDHAPHGALTIAGLALAAVALARRRITA